MKIEKLQKFVDGVNSVKGDHKVKRIKFNSKRLYSSIVYLVCPEGHDYTSRYDCFVLRGNRCKKCAKRTPIRVVISKIEDVQGDHKLIRILEPYTGIKSSKGEFLCPEGHVYQTAISSFINGCRCNICAGNKRLSFDEMRKNIDRVRGDHIFRDFEPDFKNSKCRILMTCPLGHDYKSIYGDFNIKHSRCPECNKDRLKFDLSKKLWKPENISKSYFYVQTLSNKYIK
ncbi:hypothetical protein BJO19_004752, partial [Salmonella enterica subsp. enterica serovar Norwich]|nr:hypothetical protein [Salmonella enterica subsp. enterica serovar Norwich]